MSIPPSSSYTMAASPASFSSSSASCSASISDLEVLLITSAFVFATYIVLDVDPSVFLLYDGGLARILLVVLSILLGLHFRSEGLADHLRLRLRHLHSSRCRSLRLPLIRWRPRPHPSRRPQHPARPPFPRPLFPVLRQIPHRPHPTALPRHRRRFPHPGPHRLPQRQPPRPHQRHGPGQRPRRLRHLLLAP